MDQQGVRGTWAPGGKPSQREPLPGTETHQWVDFKSDGKEKKGHKISSNQIILLLDYCVIVYCSVIETKVV